MVPPFFIFEGMTCNINNLRPDCGYNVEGVAEIRLLDWDAFGGLLYVEGAPVSAVLRSADWVPVQPDTARYTSSYNGTTYTHTLETFIAEMSATMSERLHLATKRRQLVAFKVHSGAWFVFGVEDGAALTYQGQTADNTGFAVTLTAASGMPLLGMDPAALDLAAEPVRYEPYYTSDPATCQMSGGSRTGLQLATALLATGSRSGLALDAAGLPVEITGERQAIQLRTGSVNPDPGAFEVTGSFTGVADVDGAPVARPNRTLCPFDPYPAELTGAELTTYK